MATIVTGETKIRTIANAEDIPQARLRCLAKARSMYSENERKAMKPFMIYSIQEVKK